MSNAARDLSAKLSSFRRRRSILSRAYRAARRAGRKSYGSYRRGGQSAAHFMEAEKIRQMGEREGLKIGGIQSSDRLKDLAMKEIAQRQKTVDLLQPKPVQVAPAPQGPQIIKKDLSLDEEDEPVVDTYAQNLNILNRL